MEFSSEQLCGQEVLSGVLEGMFGEGIDTNSNDIEYDQTRTVAGDATTQEVAEAATNRLQEWTVTKFKK